jgi:hypothetical protein
MIAIIKIVFNQYYSAQTFKLSQNLIREDDYPRRSLDEGLLYRLEESNLSTLT